MSVRQPTPSYGLTHTFLRRFGGRTGTGLAGATPGFRRLSRQNHFPQAGLASRVAPANPVRILRRTRDFTLAAGKQLSAFASSIYVQLASSARRLVASKDLPLAAITESALV